MSKEQLEEIQKEVNYAYRRDGSISTKAVTMPIEHYEHLYEQAERVQELERVNKQLKNNLSVYKGYYKNMIKINEDTVEENKKYRRLIKNMGQEIEVLTDVVSNADNADELNEEVIRLKGVLKNEMS